MHQSKFKKNIRGSEIPEMKQVLMPNIPQSMKSAPKMKQAHFQHYKTWDEMLMTEYEECDDATRVRTKLNTTNKLKKTNGHLPTPSSVQSAITVSKSAQ